MSGQGQEWEGMTIKEEHAKLLYAGGTFLYLFFPPYMVTISFSCDENF